MPPLKDFSDNDFATHADFKRACLSLLLALQPYQSPGGARIRLPLQTGTHFDDIAAQLEGFARALWAIGALLHGRCLDADEYGKIAEPYVRGLANGTDPDHEEYWGPVVVRDQRMVEMEIISFALLVAPDAMFRPQSERAQNNIREWLKTLNEKDFPVTNWLWFRVMTNLALVKVCGVPYDEVKGYMKDDLDQMERFYLDEGWAADGLWSEDGRQADYYSGSFAIQFSQLLYMKLAVDFDPERCQRFREKARLFASSFWLYFDENGAVIPFGRSLTYRFACAGFWSAVAFTETELPAPLNDWGVVKGLLLRHFRWWSKKDDMFNVDGTLTIGYTYPNMYMSEDYNSPQSPYWAMKSFLALGLPPDHPFWTAEEKQLPDNKLGRAVAVKPPMQIVCPGYASKHHFLLSSGQFCPWPLKATEAKYGKFAYSSHFGFCVPTGPLIQQIAPDSTLALSKDGGDTWRVPWKVYDHHFGTATYVKDEQTTEEVPTLNSIWKPWRDAEIEVKTTLIAPTGSRWGEWHVRVHTITNQGSSAVTLRAVQGGFAIYGRGKARGEVLPSFERLSELFAGFPLEGTYQSSQSALVCSSAGASGIRHLYSSHPTMKVNGEVLKPDANTNLVWQRTLVPTLDAQLGPIPAKESVQFVSAVFATPRTEGYERSGNSQAELRNVEAEWMDFPVVHLGDGVAPEGCYILLS